MAKKETQKEKLARLEQENEQLKKMLQEAYDRETQKENEIRQLLENENNSFENSPDYLQMQKEISSLKIALKTKEINNKHLVDTEKRLREKIQTLLLSEQTRKHNERGAGRKVSVTEETKKQIAELKNKGYTMRGIGREVGLSHVWVSKILREMETN